MRLSGNQSSHGSCPETADPPAVIQVGKLHLPMTGRQVKSMNSLEITEVALVEHAFLFIDIRLAEVAAAEHPSQSAR
ncbi:MAG: hypothetical protein DMG97_00410 [Acidobacteria bacterium]|nr:MAG: hypothetical protein DMG97_00410 [Acidobacteriota bacterium]PYV80261.1 MAG: hypothetical protein DMG96_00930 [Acidobacteriota bacterium]